MSGTSNILIYRLGSLGDTIVALPCFHLLQKAFPKASFTLLTNHPIAGKAAPIESVLGRGLFYDGIIDYPLGTRNPRILWRIASEIRKRKFCAVVNLCAARGRSAAWRDRVFFHAAGVHRQIGWPVQHRDFHLEDDPVTGLKEAETCRLLRRIESLGKPDLNNPQWWDLKMTPGELDEAETLTRSLLGRPFLALSVGTKIQSKDWGEINWSILITRLSQRLDGWSLLLVGAGDERELSGRCAAHWRGPVINLCGLASPRVAAAAMRGSRAFLGHDSGPMHLASAMGIPCVALFSARNKPGQWDPRGDKNRIIRHWTDCGGCGLEVCIKERKRCLTNIHPSEVETTLLELLDTVRPPSRTTHG
jgi:ADP-heptose:LPS heptosyltransferase